MLILAAQTYWPWLTQAIFDDANVHKVIAKKRAEYHYFKWRDNSVTCYVKYIAANKRWCIALQEQLDKLLHGLKEYVHHKDHKSLERVLGKSFQFFPLFDWIENVTVSFDATTFRVLTLPYLRGGQVVTPAQRRGRISSAQCATPM